MNRRGALLLEVLVAMVLLGVAGTTAVHVLRQAVLVQSQYALSERRTREGAELLSAYALLTSDELSQRIGSQVLGGFRVRVARPETGLFRVAVSDSAANAAEAIVTVLAPGRTP